MAESPTGPGFRHLSSASSFVLHRGIPGTVFLGQGGVATPGPRSPTVPHSVLGLVTAHSLGGLVGDVQEGEDSSPISACSDLPGQHHKGQLWAISPATSEPSGARAREWIVSCSGLDLQGGGARGYGKGLARGVACVPSPSLPCSPL